jgi:hypothetical protein
MYMKALQVYDAKNLKVKNMMVRFLRKQYMIEKNKKHSLPGDPDSILTKKEKSANHPEEMTPPSRNICRQLIGHPSVWVIDL